MTLVETMVAAGVLGIAILGLVRLHMTSTRQNASLRDLSTARALAAQRLERLATRPVERLVACGGPAGCREGVDTLRASKGTVDGYACTDFADGPTVATPGTVALGKFRIDTTVENHPDPTQHPEARILTVSVCFRDAYEQIREVHAERMLVPDN